MMAKTSYMTKARRAAEPRRSVFCLCGAQWHGRHAVNNPVIADHEARSTCAIVSWEDYERAGHKVRLPAHWKVREADQ